MANHKNLPFSQIHIAKIRNGLFADLPTAQGAGDAYFCTDTNQLFIATAVATWFEFVGGGGDYVGSKRQMNATFTVPGDFVDLSVAWTQGTWNFGITGTGSGFTYPDAGLFEYSFGLKLQNDTPANWKIQVFYDDASLSDVMEFATSGDSSKFTIGFSGQFLAVNNTGSGNNFCYIMAAQDSGVDLIIDTYSYMTVHYLGPQP